MSQMTHAAVTLKEDTVICRCLGITRSTIDDCVSIYGAEDVQEVKSICGAGGGCMACRGRIRCLISQIQADRGMATS